MPIELLMPALSPTMTEGNLAKWHKREGDEVGAGDVIAEIETDKATMEIEAVDEGVLGRILVAEGTQGVAVNTPIALLLEAGEDAADLDAAPVSKPSPRPAPPPSAGKDTSPVPPQPHPTPGPTPLSPAQRRSRPEEAPAALPAGARCTRGCPCERWLPVM